MSARLKELLGGAEGEVEYLRLDVAYGTWHWERVKIDLYGYDLWAYLQVWGGALPDLWVSPIGGWEFVKLHCRTKDYKSVFYCHNVPDHTVIDLSAEVEEEVVHLRMLRALL